MKKNIAVLDFFSKWSILIKAYIPRWEVLMVSGEGAAEETVMSEAVLMFTQCKIAMAQKFRDGINYRDIVEFEKKLEQIDRALASEEKKLKRSLCKND
ncbi:MAG: hypothetical protein ACRCUT_01975 [Spirochaetota bacterium]